MHYFFLDESYSSDQTRKNIVMAAWAVEQKRFNEWLPKRSDTYRSPVSASINSMLETCDAWAVRGTASLDPALFRSGEIDGTDDVTAMHRTDNIWSQCFIFLVATLIKELIRRNHEVGTVDIYHGPKSLKPDHAKALQKTLCQLIIPEAKRYDSERGSRLLENLNLRDIKPVGKAPVGQAPDKFQVGTWVADKLCSCSHKTIQTGCFSRIISWDMSDVIRKTIRQFDGKSFYED